LIFFILYPSLENGLEGLY